MIRKIDPVDAPAAVDDLLLPEGKSQKFVEDLERETERSAREMHRTFHVRQAMDELATAQEAPRRLRERAPMSDRRDARELYAPTGGADTLVDAPKVVLRSSARDAPTLITRPRAARLVAPPPLSSALSSALLSPARAALSRRNVALVLFGLLVPLAALVLWPRRDVARMQLITGVAHRVSSPLALSPASPSTPEEVPAVPVPATAASVPLVDALQPSADLPVRSAAPSATYVRVPVND